MRNFCLISKYDRPLDWYANVMSNIGEAEVVIPDPEIDPRPRVNLERNKDGQWLILFQDPLTHIEYDNDEKSIAIIRHFMDNPCYLLGQFRDVRIVNDFLTALPNRDDFLIGNDYGYIGTLNDVVRSIESGEAWEYREG